MIDLLAIPACALAGRLHGGGPTIYREYFRKHFPKIDPYLDGDITSPIAFGIICYLTGLPWYLALGGAVGWAVGWAPDIGDRVEELRQGKWKLALQRGVFLGACLSLGTWNPAFIISGAFFPLFYWLTRKGDWHWSEWLQGGAIGVAVVF